MAIVTPLVGGIWTRTQQMQAVKANTWSGLPYLLGWGSGDSGQLGLNNLVNYWTQKQIYTSLPAGSAAFANYSQTMLVKGDGTLWGWGDNSAGMLGLGNVTAYSSPKQVGALTNWSTNFSTGSDYFCLAVKKDGTLWSWGNNSFGQLGLGNRTNYSSPKQVGALTNWSSVASITNASYAIKTDGTLWSWGNNANGQLGLGNITSYSSPKQVGALTNWSKITGNIKGVHVLALKTDGTLWSWGYGANGGQLGLGNTTSYSSPKQVGALTNWLQISSCSYSSAAIKTDGTLWTWGNADYGRLGNGLSGAAGNRSSPVQIGALTNWLKISCGSYSMYAIKTDGTLWAWGWNGNGQLNTGNNTINFSSPNQIGGSTNWSAISGGFQYAIATVT